MSDDLIERLRKQDMRQRPGGYFVFNGIMAEAATALTEARAEIERLTGERDEARGIVRDTHWMAVRYADGRMSYAPGMCNRAIQKAYDAGWLTYHDHKQHDHDPQYAREGDRPEYRSIEARALAAESELSTLRDILVLCGELGGMGKDETPADYLRRLIDEVASVESLRARVREVVGPFGKIDPFEAAFSKHGKIFRLDYNASLLDQLTFEHFRAARQLMEEVK